MKTREEQAVDIAKLLTYSPEKCTYEEMISYLEQHGFSASEAKYGADHSGVEWVPAVEAKADPVPTPKPPEHVWDSFEEAAQHKVGTTVGPYKCGECTVTLKFAEQSNPHIRRKVAEMLLDAFLNRVDPEAAKQLKEAEFQNRIIK